MWCGNVWAGSGLLTAQCAHKPMPRQQGPAVEASSSSPQTGLIQPIPVALPTCLIPPSLIPQYHHSPHMSPLTSTILPLPHAIAPVAHHRGILSPHLSPQMRTTAATLSLTTRLSCVRPCHWDHARHSTRLRMRESTCVSLLTSEGGRGGDNEGEHLHLLDHLGGGEVLGRRWVGAIGK